MPALLTGRRSEAGLRLARFAVRELVAKRILGSIAEGLGTGDAPPRANLVASQIIGLVMARYVVRVEPLASLEPEALIRAIAPNLQRYLTGALE
jgi:hypothetical protein